MKLNGSLHLHFCWESGNIRCRSASPWDQTLSLPSPPPTGPGGPGPHQNWIQMKIKPRGSLEEGANSWRRSWWGEEKREDASERVLRIILLWIPEGMLSLRIRNKLKRPENPHPNWCYSVDSGLVKKYHPPKVPLEHSPWFHVGDWPTNGSAILF